MLAFARKRWFLTLLGFLLLAIFIWFAGPLFAFADYRPFESVTSRVVLFVIIVAIWAAYRLVKVLRAYRVSDRLVEAVIRQAPADDARPSAEAVQLRERFEEAVATLKQSRRTGHSLYDLPWYIIIGAPGSGKTTALLNSGLKFPLEQRVGKGALRGVGGTRNCDWWFTDEAIFLDTAGRYTTQDSDEASDRAGWREFLSLLRTYRKRRPLNGIILTISAHDLMIQGERGRERHVEAARRRLNEVNEELRIQLPVYVMVTKCDLVAGFAEYFDDLTQEGRAQIWGVTFPYEQTLNGEAVRVFPDEFDQLMARLNARVFARVEEDRDARRRARIFAFPQQMAALREALSQFVSEVFVSTRLDKQTLLRGVYLTSGTQEGTPIDRLLGAIGRRYGVAPEAVVPPTGRGKAYFVERLLKEVLIGESGLAGVNRGLEMQKAALQLGAYAAMAAIAVLGLLVLSVSYTRNRGYVAETAETLAKLEETPPLVAAATPEALLPRLNALRAVVETANQHRDNAPWSMRWGLYQGTSIGNAARDAYVRELDGTLLPRVAARIEERLVEFAPQPEKLYEYFKAYLMLGEPRYLKKDHLQFIANLEWNAADNADPDAAAALSTHFQSLLDYSETLRPIGINHTLVAQARNTIDQVSIPRLIYDRLERTYQEDRAQTVRLDLAAGVGAEDVIRRRSGKSLTEPVPSFFTRTVFQEITSKRIPELVDAFAEDDWVWGDGRAPRSARTRAEVTDLYEQEYIATWDEILNDIELVPFGSTTQAMDALAVLSGPTSPLRGLFGTVADNTALILPAEPEKPGVAETAKKTITERLGGKAVAERLGGLFGGDADEKGGRAPGLRVTAHFQEIHRMMAGEPGNAPIDRVLLGISQVHHQLRSMGPGGGGLESLSNPQLRELVRALQQDAATLPPIIQSLIGQIGRRAETTVVSSAAGEIERRYYREVQQECALRLNGRYPFDPDSATDITLSDFAMLFGVGRIFDKFFRNYLEPLVDRSRTPWTWKSGEAQGPRGLLDQFEQADHIRELFFLQGSGELKLLFSVSIQEVDASPLRFLLEIDGQGFDYQKSPRNAVAIWPGPVPGNAAVTWVERYGGKPDIAFRTPWALFRLLDAGQEARESDVKSTFLFQRDGHRARIVIEAASVVNPLFDRSWQRFTCEL